MDARVEGAPVTPRVGKCVEVNALYYNALRSLDVIARSLGHPTDLYAALASDVKKTFDYIFWYPRGGYLYDYVGEDGPDASIRPNQILSLSLPFPVLERAKGGSLLEVVERNLLTPYGLRTLSPSDPRYSGTCTGTPSNRDSSYHNGTVWPWLIGPYITARTHLGLSPETYQVAQILNHFKQHLCDAGLGSVSEIFDGDAPHRPRGCIAQAWSVGELLRIYAEDLKESKLKTL
jgi:glycogen debranching enzyme